MRAGLRVLLAASATATVLGVALPALAQEPPTTVAPTSTTTSSTSVTLLPRPTSTSSTSTPGPTTSTSVTIPDRPLEEPTEEDGEPTSTTVRRTTTTVPRSTTTAPGPTIPRTTSTLRLGQDAEPLPETTTTTPDEADGEDDRLPVGTLVMGAIAGLLVVAVGLGIFTWRFWLATRPASPGTVGADG